MLYHHFNCENSGDCQRESKENYIDTDCSEQLLQGSRNLGWNLRWGGVAKVAVFKITNPKSRLRNRPIVVDTFSRIRSTQSWMFLAVRRWIEICLKMPGWNSVRLEKRRSASGRLGRRTDGPMERQALRRIGIKMEGQRGNFRRHIQMDRQTDRQTDR